MISFFVKEVWKLIVQNTCVHRLIQKLMDIWHYILTYLCVLRRNSKPRRGSDILDYRPLECRYLFTQKPHRSLHSLSSVESLEAKNILKATSSYRNNTMKGRVVLKSIMKNQGNQQTPGKKIGTSHLKKTGPPNGPSGFLAFSLHDASVWTLQALPQCRSINNLNPLGIIWDSQALSGSDRRKFAASCILTKVQGRIWPVRGLDNKLFMKRYVREALPRLNGDDIDRSWVPIPTKSGSTSCQVWERRQFKSGRDKLSCLDSPVYQQTSFSR